MTVGRRNGSGSCPVAGFGLSGVETSAFATKNSQLIVGIIHYNVICMYILVNVTDDKMVRTGMGTANCNNRGVSI